MKIKKINLSLFLGGLIIMITLLICLSSFFYMPFEPNKMDTAMKFIPPGKNRLYLLGTDNFGRDVLSRVMVGSRTVLMVGVVSVFSGAVVGGIIGAIAGVMKGFVGSFIMRCIDALMSFPGILLAIMLVAVIGRGSYGAIVAISIYIVPSFGRLVYSLILESENLLFIKAARSYGISEIMLVIRHYFPIMLSRLITQFSVSVASAIMIEASLSFLGLGIQPPNASWGLMLNESRQYFLQYPYLALTPGIAIAVTVLGFNLFGDGLNDLIGEKKVKKINVRKR